MIRKRTSQSDITATLSTAGSPTLNQRSARPWNLEGARHRGLASRAFSPNWAARTRRSFLSAPPHALTQMSRRSWMYPRRFAPACGTLLLANRALEPAALKMLLLVGVIGRGGS